MEPILRIIEVFRQIDQEMQAQTIAIFLAVARSTEPVPMRQLRDMLGLAQSSVSRNVAALSDWTRHHETGPNLLRAWENPQDRREKFVELTPQGRRLAKTIEALLTKERTK